MKPYLGAENSASTSSSDPNSFTQNSQFLTNYDNQAFSTYDYFGHAMSQDSGYQNYDGNTYVDYTTQPTSVQTDKRSQSFGYSSDYSNVKGPFTSNVNTLPAYNQNPRHFSMHEQYDSLPIAPRSDENKLDYQTGIYQPGFDDSYAISPFNTVNEEKEKQHDLDTEQQEDEKCEDTFPGSSGINFSGSKLLKTKSEVKHSIKRRKSSTLDLLDNASQYHEHVEKHIENIPDQSSPHNFDHNGSEVPKLADNRKRFKSTHFSPSPKRTHMLQRHSQVNHQNAAYPNFENYAYQATDQYDLNADFSAKLNFGRTQSMYVPNHSGSMGQDFRGPVQYEGYAPPQNYHASPQYNNYQGYVPYQMGANPYPGLQQVPAMNNMGYNPMARETYSPDVKKSYYMQQNSLLEQSVPMQQYPSYGWNGYSVQNHQSQNPHFNSNPMTSVANNEIKMNFTQYSEDEALINKPDDEVDASKSTNHAKSQNLNVSSDMAAKSKSTLTPESCLQLAKDQSGCRMLQKRLEDGDLQEHQTLYQLILPNFVELMNNPFGNYLCQKITEKCNKDQLKEIIDIISTDAVRICCNQHGTRAIQKIVECASDQDLIDMIINVLKDDVKTLVEDINGNHAIQKMLFTFKAPNNEFIFEKMIDQCKEIACHKHGCCVMQKCIQGADEQQRSRLIDEIIKNTQVFVRNPYGNYVVQFVLDLKDFDINTRVGKELLGSLIELGNQKYSSNVIEKCLELNHREIKDEMVKEMLTADTYIDFLTDQYGNYVIQKTLGVADADDLEKLIAKIKPDMEKLK